MEHKRHYPGYLLRVIRFLLPGFGVYIVRPPFFTNHTVLGIILEYGITGGAYVISDQDLNYGGGICYK